MVNKYNCKKVIEILEKELDEYIFNYAVKIYQKIL